ncbi:MAG TPA: FtsX-like permease family protein [Candidatus Binatia bacterium]|nr:FtsX-like permease family protein [Candidatus Binatia bacterium]
MSLATFRLPRRFLRGSYGSLALTILALASGVALVCAIDLVNRTVARAFLEIIDTMAGRASLQISAGERGLMPEQVAETAARVAGVQLAVPVVTATAFLTEQTHEQLTVHAVDLTNDDHLRVYEAGGSDDAAVDDPLVFVSRPDSIMLTAAFAARHGIARGDAIALETPAGRRSFTVRGLLEPKGVARVYGGNLVVMDLFAAEAAFTRAGYVNRIDVVTRPGADVEEVARALRGALPAGLRVDTPAQRRVDLNRVIGSLQALLSGIGLVALLAAFLIAFNRLASFFERRAWQIAILAAVGVRSRTIWLELLSEALVIGAVGVAIGIPLGIALARPLLPVIATTAALNYKLIAPEADLAIRPQSLAIAALLGLAAAVLAASLPAWRAVQQGILATLRSRSREAAPATRFSALAAPAGLVLLAVVAIVAQSVTRSATFGLVATALLALTIAFSARSLLVPLLGILSPAIRRVAGPTSRFALAAVSENPRRTSLTAATLAVGLGAVFWLWTMAQSFERSVVDVLSRAIRADLIVTSSHIVSGFLEEPVDESLAGELAKVPGVAAVAGWRAIEWPHGDGSIAISAYDPVYFEGGAFGERTLQARRSPDVWRDVARGDAVIISTSLASNYGVGIGDDVTLNTPSGPITRPVAGILVEFVSPQGTLEMSRELFARYWHDHHLTRAFVKTDAGVRLDDVRSRIAERLGHAYAPRILSSGELMDYFAQEVRRAFSVVQILGLLVLFVVLVGMADSLGAGVIERTREIGTLRAQGIRRRLLGRMVVVEGLVLATVGLLLACAGGLALGILWVRATFTYLLGWSLDLYLPYRQIAAAAIATLLVCAIAAWLPARRAARIEPGLALRYE